MCVATIFIHDSLTAFLLNHSREFNLAFLACFIEFAVEWYFFPGMKQLLWISIPGFLVAIAGQALRTYAMYTAGYSFHHTIQEESEEKHVLVDHGVYAYACRRNTS